MQSIFNFDNYKTYLLMVESAQADLLRGFRTRLAKAIGCQSGYISHVLNGDAHLSLEQGFRAAEFFKLTNKERTFLLALISHQRAGEVGLRDHFGQEIQSLREDYLNIAKRVGDVRTLSEADQSVYYGSWHYVAVHVAVSLPHLREIRALASALMIPEERVRNVALFLVSKGILTEKKGKLSQGLTQIHLSRESPLINQHHTNLRIAAIHALGASSSSSVHYSTVSTMSKVDAEFLRSEIVSLISTYVKRVKPSKDETIFAFNVDFYPFLKD